MIKIGAGIRGFIITLIFLGLTGCKSAKTKGFDEENLTGIKSAVQESVDNSERVTQIIEVLDTYQVESNKIVREIKRLRAQALEMNADYETSRNDLEPIYEKIREQLRLLCNLTRDGHFEIRTLCSREEWESICKSDTQLFNF